MMDSWMRHTGAHRGARKGHTICSPSSYTLGRVHLTLGHNSSSSWWSFLSLWSSSFVRFNLDEVLAWAAHIPAYSPHFSHQSITSFIPIIICIFIIIVLCHYKAYIPWARMGWKRTFFRLTYFLAKRTRGLEMSYRPLKWNPNGPPNCPWPIWMHFRGPWRI